MIHKIIELIRIMQMDVAAGRDTVPSDVDQLGNYADVLEASVNVTTSQPVNINFTAKLDESQ